MTRPRARTAARLAGLLTAVLLLAVACGDDDGSGGRASDSGSSSSPLPPDPRWSEAAVGAERLPDLQPVPPVDIYTRETEDGWVVEFSSAVVNVGEDDFHATATKGPGDQWLVTQDIAHEQGASHVPTEAVLIWGGDGHEHWHVERYVTYELFGLDAAGEPTGEARTDHKVGFCIYDFERSSIGTGPEEAVYRKGTCGTEDSTSLVMGLSPGWTDYYSFRLPGQNIDIDDLPDGDYRLYARADEQRLFREASTDNNETWVDFTLTTEGELRVARVQGSGPSPES